MMSSEELQEVLSQYFYTKIEQEELSSNEVNIDTENTNALIEKLDELKQVNQFNMNLLYFDTVLVAGVFVLFLYYRLLAHFRERWL